MAKPIDPQAARSEEPTPCVDGQRRTMSCPDGWGVCWQCDEDGEPALRNRFGKDVYCSISEIEDGQLVQYFAWEYDEKGRSVLEFTTYTDVNETVRFQYDNDVTLVLEGMHESHPDVPFDQQPPAGMDEVGLVAEIVTLRDSLGRPIEQRSGAVVSTWKRDDHGRVIEERVNDGYSATHAYRHTTLADKPVVEEHVTFVGADDQSVVRVWSKSGNLLRETTTDGDGEVTDDTHRYDGLRRLETDGPLTVKLPEQRIDVSCLDELKQGAPWAEPAAPFSCGGTDCAFIR